MDLYPLILRMCILSDRNALHSPIFIHRDKYPVFLFVYIIIVFRCIWLTVSKPGILICEGQWFQAFTKGNWCCNFYCFFLSPEKTVGCGFKVNIPKAAYIILGGSFFPGLNTYIYCQWCARTSTRADKTGPDQWLWRDWCLEYSGEAASFLPMSYLLTVCGQHPLSPAL